MNTSATVKFGAKVEYWYDGGTEMVTSSATFVSSDTGKATFSQNVLSGKAAGTTNVTAQYGGVTSSPVQVTVNQAAG